MDTSRTQVGPLSPTRRGSSDIDKALHIRVEIPGPAALSSPVSPSLSPLSQLEPSCMLPTFSGTATIKAIIFNFRSSPP